MFVEKTQAEIEAMTPEQVDAYKKEKALNDAETRKGEIKTQIDEAMKNSVSKEELEKLTTKFTTAGEEITKMMGEINALKEGGITPETVENQINKFIADNFEQIKSLHAKGSGILEFEVKAVGDITTASGVNTSPPAITGTQQAPLGNINLRDMDITALTSNVNTSLAAYPYTEAKPKDGDYTFLSEGGTKQQIDFSWETNYAKPVKTAAWIRLTEESITDVSGLQSVANDFLRKRHNIKKTKGLLFGDGIAPNPKGATTYGRVFSAGSLALSVVTPNFMDVVNACITDIYTTHNFTDEMPYMANLVMVNPNDYFINLVSAKDANGLPLYPQASIFNRVQIGGVTIIPDELIPTGKIFVADMGMYNTTNYVGYTVRIGFINDDFIKNQFVILGESRFHAFVKKLDEQAFIYDDIATIATAITKP